MNSRHAALILLCSAVTAGLTGCAHKQVFKHGQVYRDWNDRLSEMGVLPVFPPREDIVVGDIYLLPMHPGANSLAGYVGGLGMAGIRLGYLDGIYDWAGDEVVTDQSTNLALERFYRSRPTFPTTPTEGVVTGTTNPGPPRISVPKVPSGAADQRDNVFAGRTPVRLKQVAFPEFTVTTTSQVGLSALVPIEGFLVGAGLNSSKVQSVSVKVSQAESYGLPSDWLLSDFILKYVQRGTDNKGTKGLFLLTVDQPDPSRTQTNAPMASVSGELARAMFDETLSRNINERIESESLRKRLLRQVLDTKNSMYLTVISEVYYTRQLDINIEFAAGTAAAASTRPVTVSDLKELASLGKSANGAAQGGSNQVSVTNQAPTLELKRGEDAIDMAERLRKLNLGQNGVGGSVQVVSTGARNVGLRRLFDHPIAIGVRGVVLRIGKEAVDFQSKEGTQRGFPIQLETFEHVAL
jgi:hypothetical protein